MRISYLSTVDISIPYGPGINELCFIKDMAERFGENFLAMIPKPSRSLPPDFPLANVDFISYLWSSRSAVGWLEARLVGSLKARTKIRQFNPDLIVLRSGSFPLPQLMTIIPLSIPYALKTTGSGSFDAFYASHPIKKITKGLNEALLRKLLKNAVAIDVVSEEHKTKITHKYKINNKKVHVIDNGVQVDSFSHLRNSKLRSYYGISDNDIVLGYVGGFPLQRGGKEVINMVARFLPHYQVKGIIIGDSGQADSCREYANELGVHNEVICTGEIDYLDVPDLMSCMDIGFSILREEERGASEQKVRQYLASGLCVIGTRGSNDFLNGCSFARVIDGIATDDISPYLEDFLKMRTPQVHLQRERAREFSEANLSVKTRNERRLTIWQEAIRFQGTS